MVLEAEVCEQLVDVVDVDARRRHVELVVVAQQCVRVLGGQVAGLEAIDVEEARLGEHGARAPRRIVAAGVQSDGWIGRALAHHIVDVQLVEQLEEDHAVEQRRMLAQVVDAREQLLVQLLLLRIVLLLVLLLTTRRVGRMVHVDVRGEVAHASDLVVEAAQALAHLLLGAVEYDDLDGWPQFDEQSAHMSVVRVVVAAVHAVRKHAGQQVREVIAVDDQAQVSQTRLGEHGRAIRTLVY